MAKSKAKKELIALKCEKCSRLNYYTSLSKRAKTNRKLKFNRKKFCRFCRVHTMHVESKA